MVKAFAILLSSFLPPGAVLWQATNAGNAAGSQTGRDSGQPAGAQAQPNTQRSGSQQNRDQSSRRNQGAVPDDRRQSLPLTDDQVPDRNLRRGQSNQNQADRNLIADRQLIAILAAQHQLMINISQIGMERASSESVQDFASRMVDEHSAFLNQLAAVATSDLDNEPRRELESPFTSPGRPGRTRQPNRPTNPNTDQRDTNPDRNSQPGQDQRQRPEQSALPSEVVPSLGDAPQQSFALAQVALQTQRRNGTQNQTPSGTRTNPPLVTPGRSPGRSSPDQDRNSQDRDTSRQGTRRNRDANNGIFDPNDSRFTTNNPIARALQQVAGRRFSLARSELTNLSDDDFDRAFMQLVIGLHVEIIATESALISASSPEVQQLIQDNLSAEEEHLTEGRGILSQLLGTSDSGTTPNNPNLRTNNRADQSSNEAGSTRSRGQ